MFAVTWARGNAKRECVRPKRPPPQFKKAQALGFSLDEIKRIVEDARMGQSPCDEVREIVGRRLEELDERMREMRRYRKELAETLEEWNKVGHAPGHICGLIEGSHVEHHSKETKKIGATKTAQGRRG